MVADRSTRVRPIVKPNRAPARTVNMREPGIANACKKTYNIKMPNITE